MKKYIFGFAEFLIVLGISFLFLSDIFACLVDSLGSKPEWLDHWLFCYRIGNEITRILGLNPGGIWNGGFYYPFHDVSILFDETSWGVSLLTAPIWLFTLNVFSIFFLGGVSSLCLAWVCTYYFVRSLGVSRICAWFAGALFCLSSVSVLLTVFHVVFWPFCFIPLAGIAAVRVFSSAKPYRWSILLGLLLGYLAWSSLTLFVMGGLFLALFVLWNLAYKDYSIVHIRALLLAFVVSAVIAGFVVVPAFVVHNRFGFSRAFGEPYRFASNWANLIYKSWPVPVFNPIVKTHLWDFLKTSAKGEISIGVSVLVLLSSAAIFITKLRLSVPLERDTKYSKYVLTGVIVFSVLFAFINMRAMTVRAAQTHTPLPPLAVGLTYCCYVIGGIVIYLLHNRIRCAARHLYFFFFLCAIVFGFFAFGPYYLIKGNLIVVSPVALLEYLVPGFSGIRATARWGLMLSFALSVGITVFLTHYADMIWKKVILVIFIMLCVLEISPPFRWPKFHTMTAYHWVPRQTDIFLRNMPGDGAVLELSSYPARQEQHLSSDNSLGYALYARLFHGKPLVLGYSSYSPHVTVRNLFYPSETRISARTINTLRKFGAKYFVFHIEGWFQDDIESLLSSVGALKQIGVLDNGMTLIYEDPCPAVSVGYYDVI